MVSQNQVADSIRRVSGNGGVFSVKLADSWLHGLVIATDDSDSVLVVLTKNFDLDMVEVDYVGIKRFVSTVLAIVNGSACEVAVAWTASLSDRLKTLASRIDFVRDGAIGDLDAMYDELTRQIEVFLAEKDQATRPRRE